MTDVEVPDAVSRSSALLARRPVSWTTPIFGLSAAARFVVVFDDGSTAFVKAATDPQTDQWLRTEHTALATVGGQLGPSVLAFESHAGRSLLITDDLSHGYWPAHDHLVEWRAGDIEALLDTLKKLASSPAPAELEPIVDWPPPRWAGVFKSGALQANGLCSPQWIEAVAATIGRIDREVAFEPTAFVHGDVRSDNCVIVNGEALLVDWSTAGLGNPGHDLAQLLPTLHLEGGVEPWSAADLPADLIVRLSGSVAHRVVDPQGSPEWLRQVFLRLTAIDLAWVAAVLNLDPPDGRHWRDI